MTPGELLTAARELIGRPDASTAGVWPRTSALLARQALQDVITSRWSALSETRGLGQAKMRSQLICLPSFLDPVLARQVTYTWAALSNACHYHPYELAPTAPELDGWINDVTALVAQIAPEPA